jgi:integrase
MNSACGMMPSTLEGKMQYGNLTKQARKNGPAVWTFRWWEAGASGNRVRRSMILGTIKDFGTQAVARKALTGLLREINSSDRRFYVRPINMQELADHYRQRELAKDNNWKAYSTKYAYEGYLKKWIVPRWGSYSLDTIRATEIEAWLRQSGRARGTCIKIRNLMSVLFNHARRHDLFDRNPASLVRQSAKAPKRQSAKAPNAAALPACLPWTSCGGCSLPSTTEYVLWLC